MIIDAPMGSGPSRASTAAGADGAEAGADAFEAVEAGGGESLWLDCAQPVAATTATAPTGTHR
ncbi:MAG: hypothetical protein AAF449_23205 [Myxococcota bacterium]